MLKLSTWINALPGLTHHFSIFAAKMMPTKPNTLEQRRHGYRAMRSVAGAPIRPNPKPSLLTTPQKTIAHLDLVRWEWVVDAFVKNCCRYVGPVEWKTLNTWLRRSCLTLSWIFSTLMESKWTWPMWSLGDKLRMNRAILFYIMWSMRHIIGLNTFLLI